MYNFALRGHKQDSWYIGDIGPGHTISYSEIHVEDPKEILSNLKKSYIWYLIAEFESKQFSSLANGVKILFTMRLGRLKSYSSQCSPGCLKHGSMYSLSRPHGFRDCTNHWGCCVIHAAQLRFCCSKQCKMLIPSYGRKLQ